MCCERCKYEARSICTAESSSNSRSIEKSESAGCGMSYYSESPPFAARPENSSFYRLLLVLLHYWQIMVSGWRRALSNDNADHLPHFSSSRPHARNICEFHSNNTFLSLPTILNRVEDITSRTRLSSALASSPPDWAISVGLLIMHDMSMANHRPQTDCNVRQSVPPSPVECLMPSSLNIAKSEAVNGSQRIA